VRESIELGHYSAALREPNFGDLLGGSKHPRKPLEARRRLKQERDPAPRLNRMRLADLLAGGVAAAAVILVCVNALGMQRAPRPAAAAQKQAAVAAPKPANAAPLPPARPESAKRSAASLMFDIQRELAAKGYYDGAVDGIMGPRAAQAIRNFEKANGLKVTGEPSEALLERIRHALSRSDITGSLTPPAPAAQPIMSSKIGSAQRILARYGYGPVRINGELDADTRAAIGRFESDRGLPHTGEVSDRLLRELAAYSGHAAN
jgi:peptidoglycan hydrolase-like protein with peptidoglycan-binding domain